MAAVIGWMGSQKGSLNEFICCSLHGIIGWDSSMNLKLFPVVKALASCFAVVSAWNLDETAQ